MSNHEVTKIKNAKFKKIFLGIDLQDFYRVINWLQ